MASIFDYLFTCSSCEEQYVSEGRGEVYHEDVPTLEWTLKNGRLKMKLKSSNSYIYTNTVCEYCLDDCVSNEALIRSPWVKHYLKSQYSKIVDNEYRLEVPFELDLSPEECLEAAKDLVAFEKQEKIADETNRLKELLKGLVANPDCDVSKLEKEVLNIFGKASKSTSSKATKSSSSKSKKTETSSTGSSASALFDVYTKSKLIGWLESVGDTKHRKSWKKDALVDALVDYPLADVLASFTLADLKAGMEALELSTKGKKQALIDRLISSL